ncbi:ABC transporter permease [Anaerofilum sp. BX8]|uniref:ABC transporter permease n=1 Tax=Anaerofilum hominis TaxID=2763016 RepID=A0A923I7R7_9FIRM|nr:ABC transporter permease [Anaerofilum hominis]MBC5580512.1 ABC transporter permease [Anaerofilum hominis]
MMEFLNLLGLLLLSAIRTSTPLILAAAGGSVCARSGVMAMGMEGFMLVASFGAAWGAYTFQNAWLGLLVGILFGVFYSLLYAVLCVTFSMNQVICGIGMNMFALGFTTSMTQIVWGTRAYSDTVPTLDHIQLPLVGDISVMVPLAILLAVLLWGYLFKTPQGLHMRIVGENPLAARTIGINTKKFKYLGVLICGLLCSLAGSFLSIDHVNRFVMDMTAGRGYIAVSVNILGRFNPLGAIAGGLLFGVADSLQNVVTSSSIPGQLLSMVPYVVTLLVISFAVRYVSSPAGMGKSDD